jgi:hypothetical protein
MEEFAVAENESLGLGSHNARRWDEIYNGIRDGTPWEKIAPKVSKKLHEALRKWVKLLAPTKSTKQEGLCHASA